MLYGLLSLGRPFRSLGLELPIQPGAGGARPFRGVPGMPGGGGFEIPPLPPMPPPLPPMPPGGFVPPIPPLPDFPIPLPPADEPAGEPAPEAAPEEPMVVEFVSPRRIPVYPVQYAPVMPVVAPVTAVEAPTSESDSSWLLAGLAAIAAIGIAIA